jgi:hypothetical protein
MSPDWAEKPITVPYAAFGEPQSLNLYGYVRNNPLSKGDLDGHGEWYTATGKHIGTDGLNDGAVIIVRDAKSVSFSSDHSLINSAASGTPIGSFSRAEGVAMHDAVTRSNAPNETDKTGGMHEEGFATTAGKIVEAPAGPAAKPGDNAEIVVPTKDDSTLAVHVHPLGQGDTYFGQAPSPQDFKNAANSTDPSMMRAVVGAASGDVSLYNGMSKDVQATVKLKDFPTQ